MSEAQSEISFVGTDWKSLPGVHRFYHEAMATTFEIFILHKDASYARQVAWEAFDELDRIELELSRFIENSDISRLNNLAANCPLKVGLTAFECLQLGTRIYEETGGAFDITIGSLLSCWLNEDKTERIPSDEELDFARCHTGTHLLKLDESEHTVELLADRVQIDLGGIGKGLAVDRMAELLRDWDINAALINGGYSSVLAFGCPSGTNGWPVTLSNPRSHKQNLARLYLRNRAISGSGLQKGRHIIDPRTHQPVEAKLAAWASATIAAAADALSTAFMVMSPDEIEKYCLNHSDTLAALILKKADKAAQNNSILRLGRWNDFFI